MDKQDFSSFIGGLFCGSLVGAAVVVLLTPQSGKDLRQSITEKINEIIAAGKEAVTARRKELTEEYEASLRIPIVIKKEEAPAE